MAPVRVALTIGTDPAAEDIAPLLAPGSPWDVADAARYAREELLARLPVDAWRGETDEGETER